MSQAARTRNAIKDAIFQYSGLQISVEAAVDRILATVPTSVAVLRISHRHGADVFACATEEIARGMLDAYIDQWWDHELPGIARPADPERAQRLYFEKTEEYADIDVCEVITDAEEGKRSV